MNILVTGGAGFIGSNLCDYLKRASDNVFSYDLAGSPINGVVSHVDSIMNQGGLYGAVRGMDIVVHLAAKLGVKACEDYPLDTLSINIKGTENVANACRAHNVPLIYISSSEVYGENDDAGENDQWRPKSAYALSKLVAEQYVMGLLDDCTIIRPFNIYGPGQRGDFVVQKFINACLDREPPTIYGTGNQTRCFCYVKDFCDAVGLIITTKAFGQIFNVGDNSFPMDMHELAAIVWSIVQGMTNEELPTPITTDYEDRTIEREIFRRRPNLTKIEMELGWRAKIDMDSGIRNTVQHTMVMRAMPA